MQDGITRNWERRLRRVGRFAGYTVNGFKYESPLGEIGWHITAWRDQGPIHDYWVSEEVFYSMRIHFFHNNTHRNLIEIFDAITNLSIEERNAVIEAIALWGKREESTAPSE